MVRGVWPIVVLALALRAFVAWTLPLDASDTVRECAPDERGHLQVVQKLATGRLFVERPDPRSSYEAFLPVPYLPHAAVLAVGTAELGRYARFPARTPAGQGFFAARVGSVVLGALTVLLLALAAFAWSGDLAVARWTALVAALYPQLLFLGGYGNADAYTIAAGALVVFALARWARGGEGAAGLGLLAAALALVVLGKPSGYFLLATTGVWIASAVVARRIDGRALARASAIAVGAAGPWLAWNAWRNGGDVLGLGHYAAWLASLRQPFTPGIEIPNAPRLFVEWLSHSSFGVFRNLDLYLPTAFYAAALGFLVAGLAVAARRRSTRTATDRRAVRWLAASVALNLALVVYNCWFVGFSPQGRYVLLNVVLLTAIACAAPAADRTATWWRLWPRAYVGFLALAAAWSLAVIHAHPCLGAP